MVEKSQLCFFFGFLLFKKVFIEELRGRREERKTNFKVLFRRSRAFKIQKFSHPSAPTMGGPPVTLISYTQYL